MSRKTTWALKQMPDIKITLFFLRWGVGFLARFFFFTSLTLYVHHSLFSINYFPVLKKKFHFATILVSSHNSNRTEATNSTTQTSKELRRQGQGWERKDYFAESYPSSPGFCYQQQSVRCPWGRLMGGNKFLFFSWWEMNGSNYGSVSFLFLLSRACLL